MYPEAVDMLCIPILINEVPLKALSDDDALKIAKNVIEILPPPKEMKIVILPALYYLNDVFNRSLFDEIPANSVALANLMERNGRGSEVYIFNPYNSRELLPIPSAIEEGTGGLTWAIIPVVAFGEGYIDLEDYLLEREDLEDLLNVLGDTLREIYDLTYVQPFPPVLIEDLLDEISDIEREIRQYLDSSTSAS